MPIAVLLVEDSAGDADLILRALKRADFAVDAERVLDEAQMRAALARRRWDVVLSDCQLPGFGAAAALALLQAAGQDQPFIVVSAQIGEEVAVALVKSGAHDYVMKANLARLAPAVRRALGEAAARRARRRTAEALRESEERWNFALEGAGYGVWDWDIASGRVLYSHCWLAMHGYAGGDIAPTIEGRERLIHPDDLDQVRSAMADFLGGAQPRYQNEHRARCADGSWKWMLDHGKVVSRDADGLPLRVICTHVDISERKRTEEALRELNEQLETRVDERTRELRQAMTQIIESEKLASLGALVAGVSHELNTPIGNMVLAASALVDQLGELGKAVGTGELTRSRLTRALAECHGASELIVRNGNRASDLIDSFKRVSVDQTSQRRRRFDLRSTVQDSLNALGALTRRAKATVELRIPAGIEMDSFPGHLEQVVNNLIMNSLTHGFDGLSGGHIVLDASVGDGMIELCYADDGHGIAAQVQHKVFEPFYTTRLGQGGSGLGLAIVHNLVQAIFKGRLRLESAPGQGVQLYFSLPAVTPR